MGEIYAAAYAFDDAAGQWRTLSAPALYSPAALRAQAGARLQSADLRHVQVEQHDVGLAALGQRDRLAPVAGQPHDLDPLVGAEQGRGALAHQLVVVSHDHPYRHRDRDGSAG